MTLMPVTKYHINDHDNVQGLIKMMETQPLDFQHLKIFLSRDGKPNCHQDNMFLMISPTVFGKVNVLDLWVEGNTVIIEFLDCVMQEVGYVRVDITNKNPKVLFVNWNDIRKMVSDDSTTSISNEELLEFDF